MAQPGLLYTILNFAIVIGLLVTIHEFGHYLAGRWFGVKAEAFSVGFGKELLGWTDKRGTRWKLAALPLGGYVKFAGDQNATGVPESDLSQVPAEDRAHALQAKPLWQRAVIVAAGPVTNFVFAILIFAGFFLISGHPYTPPVATAVVAGSPAAAAGLQPGDRIVAIDGARTARFEDIVANIKLNTGTPVMLQVERGPDRLSLAVTPRIVEQKDAFGNAFKTSQLGVAGTASAFERVGPLRAVGLAVTETFGLVRMIVQALGQIFSGERGMDELGGPLKIAQMSGQAAALGSSTLIYFIALMSINIGFINLLPVPVLDGGHLLLYAVEGARRRPLSQRAQELAFMSGFAALLTLMLVLTWNDLASFGVWRHLAGLVG